MLDRPTQHSIIKQYANHTSIHTQTQKKNITQKKVIILLFCLFSTGLSGLLPVHPMSYITAKRNRKKLEAEKIELDSKPNQESVS